MLAPFLLLLALTAVDARMRSFSNPKPCKIKFVALQKDAYMEKPGRNYPTFPPHTTTALEYECEGSSEVTVVQNPNHGASLDDFHAESGKPMLSRVWESAVIKVSQNDLKRIVYYFKGCECGNAFLTMEKAQTLSPAVRARMFEYLSANLICSERARQELHALLHVGELDNMLAQLTESCTWREGSSWAQAFDAAQADSLKNHHVCNNDAMIQLDLWTDFVERGAINKCKANDELCSRPAFAFPLPGSPRV